MARRPAARVGPRVAHEHGVHAERPAQRLDRRPRDPEGAPPDGSRAGLPVAPPRPRPAQDARHAGGRDQRRRDPGGREGPGTVAEGGAISTAIIDVPAIGTGIGAPSGPIQSAAPSA